MVLFNRIQNSNRGTTQESERNDRYMCLRQQSYMFAYDILPAFLFRSYFARNTCANPMRFLLFQKHWERLARILPEEHVVSSDLLKTNSYRLSEGVYCMVVTMPPAERYLEPQYIGIVFHPKVRYFVAGRSDLPGNHWPQSWTLREVTPDGHGRCGMLEEKTETEFLNAMARTLKIDADIRLAEIDDLRAHAARVETFSSECQMTPLEAVMVVAATYKVLSDVSGDTTRILPAEVMRFFQKGGEGVHRVVESILRDSQHDAFAARKNTHRPQRKKWSWHFWN